MRRAIELAQQWPHTHPNPRVGSVVVDSSGAVAGEGWHHGPGTAHAEVVALEQAGETARGGVVYVSLEPCSHQGRTPPCVDALIAAGVSTVVIATTDPDPRVSGRGISRLTEAGIDVVTGVMSDEARSGDPAYFRHRETGMPLVTVKWAMTLDGSVAAADGTSRWITGEPARREVHEFRSQVDAVVIGAGTLRADDPQLDVRLSGGGPQPRAVIVAGSGDLPVDARVWQRDPIVISIVERPIPAGQLIEVTAGDTGYPDPTATCQALADTGLLHLLLEGGPTLVSAWWEAGVINEGLVHIGALIGGGAGRSPMSGVFASISEASHVEFGAVRNVGHDVVIPFNKKD